MKQTLWLIQNHIGTLAKNSENEEFNHPYIHDTAHLIQRKFHGRIGTLSSKLKLIKVCTGPIQPLRVDRTSKGLYQLCLACSPFVLDDDLMVRVVLLHRRRRHVEASAPDLDLLLAVLGGRLGLVEASQGFRKDKGKDWAT